MRFRRVPGARARLASGGPLLLELTGYVPSTPVEEGVAAFVDWWRMWRGKNTASA